MKHIRRPRRNLRFLALVVLGLLPLLFVSLTPDDSRGWVPPPEQNGPKGDGGGDPWPDYTNPDVPTGDHARAPDEAGRVADRKRALLSAKDTVDAPKSAPLARAWWLDSDLGLFFWMGFFRF